MEKSILKTIAGLLPPISGSCELQVSRKHLGWLPQRTELETRFQLTVYELVSMGCWPRFGWFGGINCAMWRENDAALDAVLMCEFADAQPSTMSGGQLQRVLFARLMLQQSRVWLLDESFNGNRSRISVLLGNNHFPYTRTVTHVLWAMYGTLSANSVQKPHRHQSTALDYIVDCPQGCYSLVGTKLDEQGNIADATRVDWEPGMSFVAPPGYWHAHINESSEAAKLIPIQDAGLQTWLRSLDIRFS